MTFTRSSPNVTSGLLILVCLSLWFKLCEPRGDGTINEYFGDENEEIRAPELAALKQDITAEYGSQTLKDSFDKILESLKSEMKMIRDQGSDIVPQVQFQQLTDNGGRFPSDTAEEIRKRGLVIVRNTLTPAEAHSHLEEALEYMKLNNVYPAENPTAVYEVYWSKAQMRARQHPNMLLTQRALLNLWNVNQSLPKSPLNLNQPLLYVDRLRVREPGHFRLPPHADSGAIERWKDPNYRNVYRHILSGRTDQYDPFEINHRLRANMKDPGHPNGCTFFRAFQGWLSLTSSQPGDGTLRVLPLLREPTAYWMLRPFQGDVPEDLFPGCIPGKSFMISEKWHPELFDQLVSLPKIGPGDTVWWHADSIHAVESEHIGTGKNSVLYIPTGPDCDTNRAYSAKLREAFLLGNTPPDFPPNNYEAKFRDRATVSDLTDDGFKLMGFEEDNLFCRRPHYSRILYPKYFCRNDDDDL